MSVLVVELVESGNLPPEWRSGIAAKDEHHRTPLRGESGELHVRGLVELGQRKIGSGIAGMQSAGAGTHPKSFKGKKQKRDRTGELGHKSGKGSLRAGGDSGE